MAVTSASRQILGARKRQEDAYAVVPIGAGTLALVADGLGGHPAGDLASHAAVEGLLYYLRAEAKALEQRPAAVLIEAARVVDASLRQMADEHRQCEGMATTLLALYLTHEHLYRLSVGDSLIYRLRAGLCQRINELHEDEMGYITSCLGSGLGAMDCPLDGEPLLAGDRYLLASDGIEVLDNGQIAQGLAAQDAEQAADRLIAAVENKRDRHQDNTTLIALFV